MIRFHQFVCISAIALHAPDVSFAEISASDVWQIQQDYFETIGGQLTGSTSRAGKTETIRDVSLHFDLPLELGFISFATTGMTLTENDDGSVSIGYVEPAVLKISAELSEQDEISMSVGFELENFELLAAGKAGDITFDSSVGRINMALEEYSASASDLEADTVAFTGVIEDFSGRTQITMSEMAKVSAHYETGAQRFDFEVVGAETGKSIGSERAERVVSKTEIALPRNGMDIMNLAAALAEGLSISTDTSMHGYESKQSVEIDGQELSDQWSFSEVQTAHIVFDRNGVVLAGAAQQNVTKMDIPEVFPVVWEFAADLIEGEMNWPISASDDPQEAHMRLEMRGLTASDDLWAMIDPEAVIPRDPATVAVDMSGKVRNLIDWMNFPLVSQVFEADEVPVTAESVALDELEIKVAGASLNGSGALEFDNDDLQTYGGFPKPVGAIALEMSGANSLIDRLSALGVMDEAEVQGFRMMLAIMAKPDPSAGPDALVSRIELTEEGHVLANGNRIK